MQYKVKAQWNLNPQSPQCSSCCGKKKKKKRRLLFYYRVRHQNILNEIKVNYDNSKIQKAGFSGEKVALRLQDLNRLPQFLCKHLCHCRLRSFGDYGPTSKVRSCQKGMMGCWGTTSVPPSRSVTGQFALPSSDSHFPPPSQTNCAIYRYNQRR